MWSTFGSLSAHSRDDWGLVQTSESCFHLAWLPVGEVHSPTRLLSDVTVCVCTCACDVRMAQKLCLRWVSCPQVTFPMFESLNGWFPVWAGSHVGRRLKIQSNIENVTVKRNKDLWMIDVLVNTCSLCIGTSFTLSVIYIQVNSQVIADEVEWQVIRFVTPVWLEYKSCGFNSSCYVRAALSQIFPENPHDPGVTVRSQFKGSSQCCKAVKKACLEWCNYRSVATLKFLLSAP